MYGLTIYVVRSMNFYTTYLKLFLLGLLLLTRLEMVVSWLEMIVLQLEISILQHDKTMCIYIHEHLYVAKLIKNFEMYTS